MTRRKGQNLRPTTREMRYSICAVVRCCSDPAILNRHVTQAPSKEQGVIGYPSKFTRPIPHTNANQSRIIVDACKQTLDSTRIPLFSNIIPLVAISRMPHIGTLRGRAAYFRAIT